MHMHIKIHSSVRLLRQRAHALACQMHSGLQSLRQSAHAHVRHAHSMPRLLQVVAQLHRCCGKVSKSCDELYGTELAERYMMPAAAACQGAQDQAHSLRQALHWSKGARGDAGLTLLCGPHLS